MTLTEIVDRVRRFLPIYTPALSPVLSSILYIESALDSAVVATTLPHGLQSGDPVVITNFKVNNYLAGWSKADDVYTFTTEQAHDLTEGWHETVSLNGFLEPEWNSTFALLAVHSETSFKVRSALPFPTTADKAILLEDRIDGINGYYQIAVSTDYEFNITKEFFVTAFHTGGQIFTGVRVAAAVNIDRVIDQYTKQNANDLWMVVLPASDVDVAKSIYADSDAIATITASDDFRLRLLDGFTLAIIKSTVNESAAVDTVDLCRHDLLQPILKTLCGARFGSGLTTSGDFKSSLTGHGVMRYTEAYIVYRYDFEVVMDTVIDDTVYEGDVSAFRDIYYVQSVQTWTP